MKSDSIPEFVRPFLWSYDTAALDLERDKRLIITQVLNLGTRQATDWLRSVYPLPDLREAVVHPAPGVWNKKSLAFWGLIFNVTPQEQARTIA